MVVAMVVEIVAKLCTWSRAGLCAGVLVTVGSQAPLLRQGVRPPSPSPWLGGGQGGLDKSDILNNKNI